MSENVILNLGGSGGASLNFKIVGNPQPSNPSENTLWIDTDVPITSWAFSATQPEAPAEGMVWILTGKNSTVKFNALKKNDVHVYPIYAYQNIGGTFEKKDALAWQDGGWKDWALFLHPSELQYVKYANTNANLTIDGDVVRFAPSQSSNSNWVFAFKDPIDVTDKMFLRATMELSDGWRDGYCGIAVCSKLPSDYTAPSGIVAQHFASGNGVNELEIPLNSVTGNVYVVARATYATGSVGNFHLV